MAWAMREPGAGRWLRQHPWVVDGAVAIAVLGYEAMYITALVSQPGLRHVEFITAVAVVMCGLYIFRRRWPLGAFIGIYVLAWAQGFLGLGPSPASLAMLGFSIFNLSSRVTRKVVVPAVAAAGAWFIVVSQPLLVAGWIRIGTIGLVVLAGACIAWLGALVRNRRERLVGWQEFARQLEDERDAQARIAAEQERARIAREMHDIVAHSLGTIVVMADGASRVAEVNPRQAGEAMARVRDTGKEAMSEMRRMLGLLRTDESQPRAPQPGLERLDHLVEEVRVTGLRVDVAIVGEPVRLAAGVDLAAYRIIQEALTNARKHGGPLLSVVTVTVEYRGPTVRLRVVDDGQEPGSGQRMRHTAGHGLIGIHERVAAYGGSVRAGPKKDAGFEVYAVLSLEVADDDQNRAGR